VTDVAWFLVPFVAIALFAALVGLLLRDLFWRPRQVTRDRLRDENEELVFEELKIPSEEQPSGLLGRIDRRMHDLVFEAGIDSSPTELLLLASGAGLLLGGVLFLWRENLLLLMLGFAAAFIALFAYLMVARSRRLAELQRQLPEVMELLARAVRAGQAVDQAIDMAGDTMPDPLGVEFRRCARHLEMALPLDAAVRSLSRRVPIVEMRLLATTLIVQRQAGGNLPTTLERLARVIRDRLNFKRQFRAATAAGRFGSIIIAFAGPVVLAYYFLMKREYIDRFLQTQLGQILLGIAIALQVVGLVAVLLLLRSDD